MLASRHRKLLWLLPAVLVGLAGFWLLRGPQRSAGTDDQARGSEAGRTAPTKGDDDWRPSAATGPGSRATAKGRKTATAQPRPLHGTPIAASVIVTGRVSQERDGSPVPWVDIVFFKENSDWTATSDESGHYTVTLSPGAYRVRAFGDRVIAMNLPTLTVTQAPSSYNLSVVQQAVLRGRVVYANGAAASGTTVTPQRDGKTAASTRSALGPAETGSDGSFELFTAPGKLTLYAEDGEASGSVAVPAIKAGELRTQIKLTLQPNGYVGGIVRTPTQKPAAGARVLVSVRVPGTNDYDRERLVADTEGRFQWRVPRAGHVIVEAASRGFAQAVPQNFELEPGQDRLNLVLTLQAAALELSGQVVDENGRPLSGVQIAQGREGSKARYRRVYTDTDGRFAFRELGPGPHRLRARKAGYLQTRARQLDAPATEISLVMPRDPAFVPSP